MADDDAINPAEMLFVINAVLRETLREIARLSGKDGMVAVDAIIDRVTADLGRFRTPAGDYPLDRPVVRKWVRAFRPDQAGPIRRN